MDTRQQGNSSNDDLLVSWKDIAAYLKCSVRKAQRLERRDLPVRRIAGTKSIWASKAQIDRWLTVNRHWNEINKYYLDVRYPQAYRVQNNNVANDFRRWLKDHTAEAGTDLVAFFNDPEFLEVLQTQQFYKPDFDDAFREAVILGYKSERDSQRKERPTFVRIRFPASLATALRFQPVASIR